MNQLTKHVCRRHVLVVVKWEIAAPNTFVCLGLVRPARFEDSYEQRFFASRRYYITPCPHSEVLLLDVTIAVPLLTALAQRILSLLFGAAVTVPGISEHICSVLPIRLPH